MLCQRLRLPRGATVVGMEGAATLTARGEENARANGLQGLASFLTYDLYADAPGAMARLGPVDRLLIDPPRDGAMEICKALPDSGAPSRIVYVSCSPSTLSRDASPHRAAAPEVTKAATAHSAMTGQGWRAHRRPRR